MERRADSIIGQMYDAARGWWRQRQSVVGVSPPPELSHRAGAMGTAALDEVVFATITPRASQSGSLAVFGEITEPWIRLQCTEHAFWHARAYAQDRRVRLIAVEPERVEATTRGGRVYRQELCLASGSLTARCSCNDATTTGNPPGRVCRHCIAVLIACLEISGNDAVGSDVIVCPVTRQALTPGMHIYRCTRCDMSYSAEGWDFLRSAANGECCGCHEKGTVMQAK